MTRAAAERSDHRRPPRRRRSPDAFRLFTVAGLVLIAAVAGGLYAYSPLEPLVIYIIALSLTAFALCSYDKAVAGRGATRVPERVLFALALLGGSLGLLTGMFAFRHKTRKVSFRVVVAVILVIQAAGIYWFLAIRH